MSGRFLQNLKVVDLATSTNEVLMRSSFQEYPLNSALLALRQSDGRGRSQRHWCSEPGGMYLSVLFSPRVFEGLALVGALALVEMCRQEYGLHSQIRWPNDVYLEGRKLAGVLAQVKFQGQRVVRAVLGVGLNVFQTWESFGPELQTTVTTLAHHLPDRSWEVEAVARLFLQYLEVELLYLERDGNEVMFHRCEQHLEGLHPPKEAFVLRGDSRRSVGVVTGLDSQGALLLANGARVAHLGQDERLHLS